MLQPFFRIAVLGFCIMGAIKKEKQEFLQLENVVTSSTDPGFGGWFDDPMIRMIQVEGLKLQPCPHAVLRKSRTICQPSWR